MDKCPTCGRRKRRSTEANRRYWALLHAISDELKPQGQMYSPETWHKYFCQKFLGAQEIKLPNEKTLILPNGSSDLDVPEFNMFMEQVELFAGKHGCYLEIET